jgi:hypothetical protein
MFESILCDFADFGIIIIELRISRHEGVSLKFVFGAQFNREKRGCRAGDTRRHDATLNSQNSEFRDDVICKK